MPGWQNPAHQLEGGHLSDPLRLLAVFAHPDDESFVSGGTLARYHAEGVELALICATRGEAGGTGNPPMCSQAELGPVREQELRCACDVLGIQELRFLGYLDGQLSEYNVDEAEERVVAEIRRVRPHVMISFGPDGFSGHADHVTIGRIAERAFVSAADPTRYAGQFEHGLRPHASLKFYQIVFPRSIRDALGRTERPGFPDEDITTILDIADFWGDKSRAGACHVSQLGSSSLSPEDRRRFFNREHFRLAAHHLEAVGIPENDLFAGIR